MYHYFLSAVPKIYLCIPNTGVLVICADSILIHDIGFSRLETSFQWPLFLLLPMMTLPHTAAILMLLQCVQDAGLDRRDTATVKSAMGPAASELKFPLDTWGLPSTHLPACLPAYLPVCEVPCHFFVIEPVNHVGEGWELLGIL